MQVGLGNTINHIEITGYTVKQRGVVIHNHFAEPGDVVLHLENPDGTNGLYQEVPMGLYMEFRWLGGEDGFTFDTLTETTDYIQECLEDGYNLYVEVSPHSDSFHYPYVQGECGWIQTLTFNETHKHWEARVRFDTRADTFKREDVSIFRYIDLKDLRWKGIAQKI